MAETLLFECTVCGQNLSVAHDQTAVTCSSCGAPQFVPKSRQENIVSAFNHANELRVKGDFDAAETLIREVLINDPTDAIGYWCRMLCRYGITYVQDELGKYVPDVCRSVDVSVFEDKDYKHTIQKCEPSQKEAYITAANAIEAAHKPKRYESALLLEKAGGLEATTRACALFQSVGDFEDAPAHLDACNAVLEQLQTKNDTTRKKKDRKLIIAVAVAVVIVLMIPLTTMVIMPSMKYSDAQNKLAAGQYTEAIAEFIDLGSFSDAPDMVQQAKAARTKASLAGAQVGDSVYLGSYEQNNDLTDGLESLEWKVLEIEDGRALIVTRYVIDARTFNDSDAMGNDYKTSQLYEWLNTDFKETAFSEDELSVISGDVNLLTRQQIESDYADYLSRVAEGTKYAVAHAVWKNAEGACRYWINDPDAFTNSGSTVGPSGAIDTDRCFVSDARGGVRPCIWVTIS